ncbi:hypothetical protein B277_07760 [Janibacter hoylei PVAS-1]|uniref:Uncharacterized protein n=1 Tax=Janibacter hoylei PVAS-1 TaxID=1210046 RepID=K1EQ74_9MICO|nr:hypothetical protein B277_07760 [Janibacter hoylei PVAS-1]
MPGPERRRARAMASSRFSSPSAAVCHCGSLVPPAATKVGSPPIVRRTSPCVRSSSTDSPSAVIAAHCSSLTGWVTRGSSAKRVTVLAKSKVTCVGAVAPLIGAADAGCGVHERGMCPSPQSRPEVASSPIHPAPGT